MKNSILLIIGYIFGRKQFYKVGMVLQHIAHRMMGIGNYENTFLSGENFVVQHIHRLLSSKDAITFIDVGAGSKSENTKLVLEYFPNSRCYLFEPMAATFKGLKQLYSGNRNITCYQLAVGNKNADIEIYEFQNYLAVNRKLSNVGS